jgi:hypothetical protein
VVQLPWRFDLGLNFSYSSAPPFSAIVGGIDFNGDGTTGDLLPGTTAGAFNRGLGRADLVRLVDQFNQTYALPDPRGRTIPRITLPATYSFDHGYKGRQPAFCEVEIAVCPPLRSSNMRFDEARDIRPLHAVWGGAAGQCEKERIAQMAGNQNVIERPFSL